jgi:hypothetical protein
MASEIQKGTATIQGIQNGGSAISITGYATFLMDTIKGQHKFDLEGIKENGHDAALVAANAHIEADIAFRPSGATRAAASAVAVFLSPLATVTLANFKVTAFNGAWIYVGDESIDLNQNTGTMSLKVRKYDDTTQNASLQTTITG